jgi:hypothetical protein
MACTAAAPDAGTDRLITSDSWWRRDGVGHAVGVPIDLSALPDDPATLQRMLRQVVAEAEPQQAALQGGVTERNAESTGCVC